MDYNLTFKQFLAEKKRNAYDNLILHFDLTGKSQADVENALLSVDTGEYPSNLINKLWGDDFIEKAEDLYQYMKDNNLTK